MPQLTNSGTPIPQNLNEWAEDRSVFDPLYEQIAKRSIDWLPNWLVPNSDDPTVYMNPLTVMGPYGAVSSPLYKGVSNLVDSIKGSRPALKLAEMLETFKPAAPDLDQAVAGHRITNRFQKMAPPPTLAGDEQLGRAAVPEGLELPTKNRRLPSNETAKTIVKERNELIKSANKTKEPSFSEILRKTQAPVAGGIIDPVTAAATSIKSGTVKQFSPEAIAEMNKQILANAEKIKVATPPTRNQVILDAVRNRGSKPLAQVAKEFNLTRQNLQRLMAKNGIHNPIGRPKKSTLPLE
jgi:DNA-binding phage protein